MFLNYGGILCSVNYVSYREDVKDWTSPNQSPSDAQILLQCLASRGPVPVPFWNRIPWDALHEPIRTTKIVPESIRPAIADLRRALCQKIGAETGQPMEECVLKALWFSDRILFATKRKARGGRRGQQGETLVRTLSRRVRLALEGQWNTLWDESAASERDGGGHAPSVAQQLARDIQEVMEALGDADVRGALKKVDGAVPLASDAKARKCLPKLFPQAGSQPAMPDCEPVAEDEQRFMKELAAAYRHAPRNRGAGPGGTLGEHWNWMPAEHPYPFEAFAEVAKRVALGRVPLPMLQAHFASRILAGDRDESDKVRPLALGNFHRRQSSKAVGRTFQSRVNAALSPVEFSL